MSSDQMDRGMAPGEFQLTSSIVSVDLRAYLVQGCLLYLRHHVCARVTWYRRGDVRKLVAGQKSMRVSDIKAEGGRRMG